MANLRADNLTGTGGRNAIDGSVFFEGESSYLEMASGVLISGTGFGTNDFTIEFWINQGVNASNYTILFAYTSSTAVDRFEVAMHSSTIQVYTDTGSWRDTGYAPVSGQWEHIAFVRNYSGNTLKMYANGVEKWSVSNNHDYNEAGVTQIGSYGSSSYGYFEGYFSNFRVVNGTALYTTNNFTPPTEKLTAVENTVLLCCQDSDNALQEATGKTITGYGNLAAFSSGDNLVTNGTFDSATTGWTSDGTMAIDSNRLKITNDAANYRSASQDITVVVGKSYRVSADCIAGTSNNSNFHVGNTGTSNAYASAVTSPVVVRPSTTTLRVVLNVGSNTPGHTALYDNVEVREVEPPKAPKVLPPVGIDEGVTFKGDTKVNTQGYMYFPTGDTSQRGRGRGLYTLGYSHPSGGERSEIEYFNIQSQGNAVQFGNLTATKYNLGSGSSATRGVFCGGYDGTLSPSDTDIKNIDYVEIATTGNAQDFGDRTQVGRSTASASSATRVCMATAVTGAGYQATIDYITTATKGDAISFGSLGAARTSMCNASASPTRGIFAGGYEVSPVAASVNTMEYITMASTSSAVDFGDLTSAARDSYGGTASSNTRGCIGLAKTPGISDAIDYITIASKGNASDFGNLTDEKDHFGSCSNSIRGVFIGGRNPHYTNGMDYITIATTGNAQDFGDISYAAGTSAFGAALSDCHGGLS